MRKVLFLLFLPALCPAKDFGVWGDVYPVQEQSFLGLIQDRLGALEKSGRMAELQEQFRDRVVENTLRPTAVPGLLTDTESHTHWFDPTFTVASDIADHEGQIFAHKGKTFNPLDTVPMNSTLYFLDADDLRQVNWMKAQTPPTLLYKVILVGGNIREAAKALDTRIYFDQDGMLTRRLGIQYIPAEVRQDGNRLRITSAAMPAEGGQ
ncbi:type-F conjugative transfer system protein TraW [Entomohabitans teleogrylli]|uniref:type-F conjugative transfer system protein TraW n=1 Tax=Entomohabitans teleogrylli TaxID=1384589 RepID=UPI00073D7FD5|nr:type-F conjugative transfer system protein TraW [Entomohabitans teleogrylli]